MPPPQTMGRHQITGRTRLGLALALFTALIWGGLPLVLKVLLSTMDAATITWARFLLAALALLVAGVHRQLPPWSRIGWRYLALLPVAAAGLGGNYVLYLAGLNHVAPGTAQIVIQLAPLFMMAGSLVLFGERFAPPQWLGVALLLAGLLLYFDDRVPQLLRGAPGLTTGVLLVLAAAASWAAYALAQKQLLVRFTSGAVLLCVYGGGGLALWPLAHPGQLLQQAPLQLALLLATAVATLASYWSFAGALAHVEASRVSIVIALTPLITVAAAWLAAPLAPALIQPEALSWVSVLGAVLVVAGSVVTALARRGAEPPPATAGTVSVRPPCVSKASAPLPQRPS